MRITEVSRAANSQPLVGKAVLPVPVSPRNSTGASDRAARSIISITLRIADRDIEADIQTGHFRQDLLFRLNVIEVRVPALRERPEDIVRLARHFVTFFAAQLRRPAPQLSRDAEALLAAYCWPGNVRELRNTIERALILWPASIIEPEAFPDRMTGSVHLRPVVGGDFSLDEIEREHIVRVVERAPTLDRAAEILKIDATTLWRKRKRYE
jgi:two-component system, NtrC family, response regulator AlgB